MKIICRFVFVIFLFFPVFNFASSQQSEANLDKYLSKLRRQRSRKEMITFADRMVSRSPNLEKIRDTLAEFDKLDPRKKDSMYYVSPLELARQMNELAPNDKRQELVNILEAQVVKSVAAVKEAEEEAERQWKLTGEVLKPRSLKARCCNIL